MPAAAKQYFGCWVTFNHVSDTLNPKPYTLDPKTMILNSLRPLEQRGEGPYRPDARGRSNEACSHRFEVSAQGLKLRVDQP